MSKISSDEEFVNSDAFKKIKWIADQQKDIYAPNYTDVLRVAFTSKFPRSKISDLVSLLSGRDSKTRKSLESIAEESFLLLKQGVEAFANKEKNDGRLYQGIL